MIPEWLEGAKGDRFSAPNLGSLLSAWVLGKNNHGKQVAYSGLVKKKKGWGKDMRRVFDPP
jgi:hypothetical protein